MDGQRRIKKNPSRSDDELGFSCLISRTDPNARLLISRVRIGLEVAGRVILNPNPNLYLCMASLGAFSHGARDEIAQTINFIFRTGSRESQTKPPVFSRF